MRYNFLLLLLAFKATRLCSFIINPNKMLKNTTNRKIPPSSQEITFLPTPNTKKNNDTDTSVKICNLPKVPTMPPVSLLYVILE